MKIIEVDNESANIQISLRELKVLNNVIIETFNGISVAEFKTRTVFFREEVEQVRKLIVNLLTEIEIGPTTVKLSTDEILILTIMLGEVCHGFDIDNFEIKIGVTKKEAEDFCSTIHSLEKELIKLR